MRYAHAGPPSWSKYDIGDAERDQLAAQTVAVAAALGFDLPDAAIRGVKLMESADAIGIELDGDGTGGSAGRHYIQYPMQDRGDPNDPVTLKPEAAHGLLTYLHEQRWRQERRRALAGLTGAAALAHEDGDTLTRWSRAMKAAHPERIEKLRVTPMPFREISHECRATLRTTAGKVRIEGDAIVLPFMVPETFAGMSMRSLGHLIGFPPCGDDALDAEIADLMILELEPAAATPAVPAHTTIKLFTQQQRPLEPTDSRWRRLRAIRPIMAGIPPGYVEPDLAGGVAAYHAQCDQALGDETALPVRLEMEKAP